LAFASVVLVSAFAAPASALEPAPNRPTPVSAFPIQTQSVNRATVDSFVAKLKVLRLQGGMRQRLMVDRLVIRASALPAVDGSVRVVVADRGANVDPAVLDLALRGALGIVKLGPKPDDPIVALGPKPDDPIVALGPKPDDPIVALGPKPDDPIVALGPKPDDPLVSLGPKPDDPSVIRALVTGMSSFSPAVLSFVGTLSVGERALFDRLLFRASNAQETPRPPVAPGGTPASFTQGMFMAEGLQQIDTPSARWTVSQRGSVISWAGVTIPAPPRPQPGGGHGPIALPN